MIAELRQKSQLTIPAEIIKKFELSAGDKLEIFEKDGMICLMPVVVYPKSYVDDLKVQVAEAKVKYEAGDLKAFDSVDKLLEELDK